MNKRFLLPIFVICSFLAANSMELNPDKYIQLCVEDDTQVDNIEKLLLTEFNGNADIYNSDGQSALCHAAQYGSLEICRLLLRYGAQMTPTAEYKITPLMFAISNNESNLEICKLLLQYNASVNARTKGGFTALMEAVHHQYPHAFGICSLLLEHGADLDPQENEEGWKDNDGRTALICAVHEAKNERIARLFVDHQMKLERNMFCLLWCLKNCERPSGKMLYRHRKDLLAPYLKKFTLKTILNARYCGRTPYYWAKQNEWKDIEWLKPKGCAICWKKSCSLELFSAPEHTSPCCEHPICERCWQKSTQERGACPFCARTDKINKAKPWACIVYISGDND